MSFTIIFAAEPGAGAIFSDDVGHCWVAVEHPKDNWTVRGFYPDAFAFGAGIWGATGRIHDDYNRFKTESHPVRTNTRHGLSEGQVRSALNFMFSYGASARLSPKRASGRGLYGKQFTMPAANHPTKPPSTHDEAQVTSATHGWWLFDQCAYFAVGTCKAAGFLPVPYNTPRLPWRCYDALGAAGDIDRQSLPSVFRKESK